eukprot:CAMPEP_0181314240 /NCGR_PEP_ID=MMETSP1101-20121128/14703_1 /TAXON_ID=46948 /ORGANISM="Rhodomonas abbreviata, Strain Caron Lab Isolate" /LENGTH=43 /DNA_ID= /DNA_START= /DNA_END= /DNA_ORIENTATION=
MGDRVAQDSVVVMGGAPQHEGYTHQPFNYNGDLRLNLMKRPPC